MNKIKIPVAVLIAAVTLSLPFPAAYHGVPDIVGSVYSQDDWKTEFDVVCAKTQDPMALSTDELRTLIGRCDKLRPLIDKLDDTQRKVYLRRLQMCKDLYSFVLDSKENK
jgi:hypothetical protein